MSPALQVPIFVHPYAEGVGVRAGARRISSSVLTACHEEEQVSLVSSECRVKASFATPFLLVPVLAVLPYFLYSFLLFVFDYAGLLFIVVCGLLIVVASLAVAPRLQSSGCGCCDVRAQLPQGMWNLS